MAVLLHCFTSHCLRGLEMHRSIKIQPFSLSAAPPSLLYSFLTSCCETALLAVNIQILSHTQQHSIWDSLWRRLGRRFPEDGSQRKSITHTVYRVSTEEDVPNMMLSPSTNNGLSHWYAQRDYFTSENGLITAQAYSRRREHSVQKITDSPFLIEWLVTLSMFIWH